jgi:hypothetical protein
MTVFNGSTVPDDFPASQFETWYQKLGSAYGGLAGYGLIFEAQNAISYRFKALAEYDQSFTASFNAHRDGQPFRYHQERDLFGFFSNGYSVFEAFCFALFAVGTLKNPAHFPLTCGKHEQAVRWNKMQQHYLKAFPGDPILNVLKTIADDAAFKELGNIRNILTHRAVGARQLSAGTGPSPAPPDNIPRLNNLLLDAGTTSTRRSHVARLLGSGLEAAHKFI